MMFHLQQRQELIRSRRQRRKLAKQARVRRQIVRYSLLCLLLAAAASVFLFLPWSLSDGNRDIALEGNRIVSVEQVREALGNFIGKPLYRLDPKLMESRVKSLAAVRYAVVRRYVLPRPHLVVQVMEEFPWATFAYSLDSPPAAVISETGRTIPLSEFPNIVQPEFKIYGPAELQLSKSAVAEWASWTSYIASQTGHKVDYVDLRRLHDIWIQDGDLGLKVGAADSTLSRRLGRLASVMPVLDQVHGRVEYIDLSLDNNIPLKIAKAGTGRDAGKMPEQP